MGTDRKGACVRVLRGRRPTAARNLPPRGRTRPLPAELRRRKHEHARREASTHGSTPHRPALGGRRVLIVDDESPIRLICRINLTASGWLCDEAEDGEQALEHVRQDRPDIVLLDVMMPRIDGWTVAEELAADPATRDVPVVFMTARGELRDRERAYAAGAVGYVTKPLDPLALPGLIEETLERLARGEREQLRREVLEES